jgi:phosphoribosylamine---glycine ligase
MADSKVNVLLVGSGGREHAIAWKLLQSPLIGKLYVAPGNAGTEDYNIPIGASDIKSLAKFAKQEECFTVIGPESPLALGLVDELDQEGLRSFGPNKQQAKLEASKSYAKQLMKSIHIPSAEFEIFKDYESALYYSKKREGNVVIKADGLASGKGVFVCSDLVQAESALKKIFFERIFGDSGNTVVIEEKLTGYEVSVMAICDGKGAWPFGTAMDHKRLLDSDKGPNTGGMGAFSPALGFDEKQVEDAMKEIVNPVVRKTGFKGFLYLGLIVTKEGPKVLEFNARLGDPETQAILPRLCSDFLETIIEIEKQEIKDSETNQLVWDSAHSCSIVMCSRGYPSNPELGLRIYGIEDAQKLDDIFVFHSGTKRNEVGNLVTNGGRVLSVTAKGGTLRDASDSAYKAVKVISWNGENHRSDIGRIVPI